MSELWQAAAIFAVIVYGAVLVLLMARIEELREVVKELGDDRVIWNLAEKGTHAHVFEGETWVGSYAGCPFCAARRGEPPLQPVQRQTDA